MVRAHKPAYCIQDICLLTFGTKISPIEIKVHSRMVHATNPKLASGCDGIINVTGPVMRHKTCNEIGLCAYTLHIKVIVVYIAYACL